MKHHAQYQLKGGKVAHGQPDWAFIYNGYPIFIVEANVRTTLENEIGQLGKGCS
jgi:hypothetical protein